MAGASSGVKKGRSSQGVRYGKQPIEKGRWAAKGTKPLPEQASVKYVLTLMVVHVCRKVLFVPTEVKIMMYSMGLFFGSLVCDFLPLPQVYMGQRDNVFNLYFVKVSFRVVSVMLSLSVLLYGMIGRDAGLSVLSNKSTSYLVYLLGLLG